MKLNKIFLAFLIFFMSILTVFADSTQPVVTKRKQVDEPVKYETQVEKNLPAKKNNNVQYKKKTKSPIKNSSGANMVIERYNTKNVSDSNSNKVKYKTKYCKECYYKKQRSFFGESDI